MKDDDEKALFFLAQIKKVSDKVKIDSRVNDQELFYMMLREELYRDSVNAFTSNKNNIVDLKNLNQGEYFNRVKRLFRPKFEPGVIACLNYFARTGQFSKYELHLITKLKLFRIVNPKLVELNETQSISYRLAIVVLGLIGLYLSVWLSYVIITGNKIPDNVVLNWCVSMFTGLCVRFFWDRSFGKKKLLKKIRNLTPWLVAP